MKLKSVLAVAALAVSSAAMADSSVNVQYFNQKAASGGALSHYTVTGFKTDLTKNIAIDVAATQQQADATNLVTNRWETGLSGKLATVGPMSFTLRASTGVKAKSGVNSFGYYSVEPGVSVALPAGFTAAYGRRYRDAFDSANADNSITNRYTLSYNLTKVDKVSFRVDDVRGDGANKSTGLIYSRSF